MDKDRSKLRMGLRDREEGGDVWLYAYNRGVSSSFV